MNLTSYNGRLVAQPSAPNPKKKNHFTNFLPPPKDPNKVLIVGSIVDFLIPYKASSVIHAIFSYMLNKHSWDSANKYTQIFPPNKI